MNMTEPTNFTLPKKPRVRPKEAPPDARKVVVLPFKAVFDKELTHGALQVLAAICAYCNRAGITWVSQTRLATELGISQQAVAKQFKQLRDKGYLETVKKGFKGERTDTIRVVFDKSVDTDTAIAVTSSIEDTRPPYMKEKQMDELPDPAGQRKVAQLIAQALKQPLKPKERTMPASGQTRTVKKMKEDIQKAQSKNKKTQPIHNPQVVNVGGTHSQPQAVDNSSQLQPTGCSSHNLQVVHNTELTHREVIKEYLKEDCLIQLHNNGLSDEVIADNLSILLDTYRSEGLTPKPDQLVQDIIQLSKV